MAAKKAAAPTPKPQPARMNARIKARWVAALRSGKYKPTQHMLRNEHGYCCLGVLCDLHSKSKGGKKWRGGPHLGRVYEYMKDRTGLPPAVLKWAGLSNEHYGDVKVRNISLADTNDVAKRNPFPRIADLIEKYL